MKNNNFGLGFEIVIIFLNISLNLQGKINFNKKKIGKKNMQFFYKLIMLVHCILFAPFDTIGVHFQMS
jgi:hypothetical protein